MKRFFGVVGILLVLVVLGNSFGLSAAMAANVEVYDASGSRVGGYSTIQEGINACPTGGKVSVSSGTYNEAIYINKRIALVGVGMPVIDASVLGTNTSTSTVTFDGLETADASISGFKITGAKGANGINCKVISGPSITDNIITGNKVNGINCSSSYPIISNNTITGNGNYGINCFSSSPAITNNTITGSSYGISCSNSSPIISNNTITGNKGHSGIYCSSNSYPTISNNRILENGDGISAPTPPPNKLLY